MSGFLQKIFSFKRESDQTPQEKRRMENLIRRTEKASPIAADILKQAREKGVTFRFSSELSGAFGAYSFYRNEVVLSPHYPDEDLMTTLVHEGRHSLQELRRESSQNLKTAIVVNRAQEADAYAFQTAAAFEMKKTAPRAYAAFLYKYPDLMWGYEKEFYKNRRVSDGLSGAFKEWFNYEGVENYDERTVEFMKLARTQRGAYRQNLNGEEVAAKICRYKGRGYLQDGFLSSRKALTVSEEIAVRSDLAERDHIRHTLLPAKQTSADLFYVRRADGRTALPKRREEKRNVALANAVRAAKIRREI